MTLDEAKKLGLCLFDIHGITPWIKHLGGDNYGIEMLFEGEIYLIEKSRY